MGNPTKVYFYREDVMLAKEVQLQSSAVPFSVTFEIFINTCVAQAHHYAKAGQSKRVFDILYIAEEHILPGYKSNGLSFDGLKEITTFEKTFVFDDIEKIIPKTSSFLQYDLYTWVRCSSPRFPRDNTLFRLLVKSIARPGMFFFDKEEMEELVKAVEPMTNELGYDLEWKDIIKAHRSEEYDLALFYSFM
jgi:hypothetical protein